MEHTMANSVSHPLHHVKQFLAFCLLVLGAFSADAQLTREQRKLLSEANTAYREGRYSATDSLIREAQNLGNSDIASYNAGNSAFAQGEFEEAARQFQSAQQLAQTPEERSNAAYNRGNSLIQQKKTAAAIDAYKEALRNNPNNEDARHNLAYAMQQQEQEQQQDQQQDQQQQDQQQQDQQQQDQQQQDQQQQGDKQEMRPGQISKEDAERMLDELNRKERTLMQQQRNKKSDSKTKNIEKDW
jgi:Ca-activated chloride channel family protein